jgi:hypothetical protein
MAIGGESTVKLSIHVSQRFSRGVGPGRDAAIAHGGVGSSVLVLPRLRHREDDSDVVMNFVDVKLRGRG